MLFNSIAEVVLCCTFNFVRFDALFDLHTVLLRLCGTYPKSVIVPKDITDEELLSIHSARNNARFPTAAWRFSLRDTVLMRSSQPCCGIFNYRFPVDERLLENTRKATNGGLLEISTLNDF